jgi:hypothetical protein
MNCCLWEAEVSHTVVIPLPLLPSLHHFLLINITLPSLSSSFALHILDFVTRDTLGRMRGPHQTLHICGRLLESRCMASNVHCCHDRNIAILLHQHFDTCQNADVVYCYI